MATEIAHFQVRVPVKLARRVRMHIAAKTRKVSLQEWLIRAIEAQLDAEKG